MTESYGLLMANALKAVRQMHSDCAKLLLEVDQLLSGTFQEGRLRGWTPVHQSLISSDLSGGIKRGYYMAEGLYRYYQQAEVSAASPVQMRGLTIVFFDGPAHSHFEPVIVGGEIIFLSKWPTWNKVDSVWDIWDLYMNNRERFRSAELPVYFEAADLVAKQHLQKATLYSRPLYSISSTAELESFCERIWLTMPKEDSRIPRETLIKS